MEGRTQLDSTPVEDFENGDYLMATKILTSRIRHDPDNYELYFERSICHHKLGNYQASLEDADAAIRLNPSDYNVHYQKSLALIRLYMFDDALSSALKAIELRAGRAGTKMSDIFKLIKDHIREMKIVREQSGENGQQQARVSEFGETAATTTTSSNAAYDGRSGARGETVDSTTDRLVSRTSPQNNFTSNIDNVISNKNSLVMQCNNNQSSLGSTACANQMALKVGCISNRVSSSAMNCDDNSGNISTRNNQMSKTTMHPIASDISSLDMTNHHSHHVSDQCKAPSQTSMEWNIRRSERIFLHNTNEPGTSSPQLSGDNLTTSIRAGIGSLSKQQGKTNSNPSSVSSATKTIDRQLHKTSNVVEATNVSRYRDETHNSHMDSDIDVEDINSEQRSNQVTLTDQSISGGQRKRVMVAPSSSMPATSQTIANNTAAPRDDSYSSKYKRLRRDRERARRGTSKLCTIKLSDLEELHRTDSEKRYMRVIAPIDGWLYSGQLGVDDGNCNDPSGQPHYVVKLDGDSSGSSYLFTQETVLNDVIKEVQVKSVSDLRKGARICCYWSRTYKCLSTGVVTSRTFEATKSLVSVKYDNGDLSALPLEDLRLLPPDYPKYMSNCDPLLLAKNTGDTLSAPMEQTNSGGAAKVVVDCKSSNGLASLPNLSSSRMELSPVDNDSVRKSSSESKSKLDDSFITFQPIDQDDSEDDEVIPPTNQAIDFITNEDIGTDTEDGDVANEQDQECTTETKDEVLMTNEASQMVITNGNRASPVEKNFGVEYRPWVFEGAPKRSKRHGRTYRDHYTSIRRGNEVLRIGDSAELMPRDASVLPFIAKIDGIWGTGRGEMRVRVRWYYRLIETEGEQCELKDGDNALFETDHFDENDVQSIWRSSKILSWTDYCKDYLGHENKQNDGPKVFYLAGYYDPVRRIKHLRSDVKEVL